MNYSKKQVFVVTIALLTTLCCGVLLVQYRSRVATETEAQNTAEQQSNNDSKPIDNTESNETPVEKPTEQPVQNPETPEETKTPVVPAPTTPTKANWWSYPAGILPVTKSGNDLLVLVNKKYKLPSNYAPSDLVAASGAGFLVTSTSIQVRNVAMGQLKLMEDAATAAGIKISIASGYRSYSTQASTYQYWVKYNSGSADAADHVSARAGHSQHQLGTAIDFSSPVIGNRIGPEFNGTAAQKWLAANAWKYGFALAYPEGGETVTGYNYESWHYRYIGVENATEWKASGKLLEVWLGEKNGG